MLPRPTGTLHVACLCAAWCRLCDDYAPVFELALTELSAGCPALLAHWIDIEDEADLVGDFDVETFPTIVVADDHGPRFAGPLTPQPDTLRRLLRATVQEWPAGAPTVAPAPPLREFVERLRLRAPGALR